MAPVDIAHGRPHLWRMTKPPLRILLAAPRGFCAGVVRAIDIVERALALYGAPVYVRHEIVHNKFVVDDLKAKGAIFVDELDEIPPGDRPVVFSAHGVPKSVPEAATARHMFQLDATCPLVTKVHMEAQRHHAEGCEIILIGHQNHPEVIGTMGQLPPGAVRLIETVADADSIAVKDPEKLAYVTQTTLSVDDTKDVIAALQRRFPGIKGPYKEDICYATTNRQEAVKEIAGRIELLLVVGAPNSSNSKRLVEVGLRHGTPRSLLVQRASELDWPSLQGLSTLGITAGASAPELLVNEIIDAFRAHYEVTVETVTLREENVTFKLPRELREAPAPL
ncbi:4-hydroxy-3-methylbut-2-enyl diphosphate reductase [Aestuariivirga sp.]|uniref:4-hydroxy-3-methylbut-2-enyl diphosphate reductase n=1 Tax=Aestuariivirga sp. TaxID=2650926 RepID=UPI003BA86566